MTSAYKDPVENQIMIKILSKMITGFFVVTLGVLWYCSLKYYVKPSHHIIVIYDIFGKQLKIDDIRTRFKTREVAQSYILEYQKHFPHCNFSLSQEIPMIKKFGFQNF